MGGCSVLNGESAAQSDSAFVFLPQKYENFRQPSLLKVHASAAQFPSTAKAHRGVIGCNKWRVGRETKVAGEAGRYSPL